MNLIEIFEYIQIQGTKILFTLTVFIVYAMYPIKISICNIFYVNEKFMLTYIIY